MNNVFNIARSASATSNDSAFRKRWTYRPNTNAAKAFRKTSTKTSESDSCLDKPWEMLTGWEDDSSDSDVLHSEFLQPVLIACKGISNFDEFKAASLSVPFHTTFLKTLSATNIAPKKEATPNGGPGRNRKTKITHDDIEGRPSKVSPGQSCEDCGSLLLNGESGDRGTPTELVAKSFQQGDGEEGYSTGHVAQEVPRVLDSPVGTKCGDQLNHEVAAESPTHESDKEQRFDLCEAIQRINGPSGLKGDLDKPSCGLVLESTLVRIGDDENDRKENERLQEEHDVIRLACDVHKLEHENKAHQNVNLGNQGNEHRHARGGTVQRVPRELVPVIGLKCDLDRGGYEEVRSAFKSKSAPSIRQASRAKSIRPVTSGNPAFKTSARDGNRQVRRKPWCRKTRDPAPFKIDQLENPFQRQDVVVSSDKRAWEPSVSVSVGDLLTSKPRLEQYIENGDSRLASVQTLCDKEEGATDDAMTPRLGRHEEKGLPSLPSLTPGGTAVSLLSAQRDEANLRTTDESENSTMHSDDVHDKTRGPPGFRSHTYKTPLQRAMENAHRKIYGEHYHLFASQSTGPTDVPNESNLRQVKSAPSSEAMNSFVWKEHMDRNIKKQRSMSVVTRPPPARSTERSHSSGAGSYRTARLHAPSTNHIRLAKQIQMTTKMNFSNPSKLQLSRTMGIGRARVSQR